MKDHEITVKIAHAMYQCRDSARSLYGDDYKEKIDPYIQTIKKTMDDNGLNEIESVLRISKRDGRMPLSLLMAAAIEITEE